LLLALLEKLKFVEITYLENDQKSIFYKLIKLAENSRSN